MSDGSPYVGRGGEKMAFALDAYDLDVSDLVVVDLGSNVGGFVDCLLQRGARRVYSVDTSYGTLAWKLRQDERVVVMERTNALHVRRAGSDELPAPPPTRGKKRKAPAVVPEAVDLVTSDVGWTPQGRILPVARALLADRGRILSLVKPQYEATREELDGGFVRPEAMEGVLGRVREVVGQLGFSRVDWVECPLGGGKRNREFFLRVEPGRDQDPGFDCEGSAIVEP